LWRRWWWGGRALGGHDDGDRPAPHDRCRPAYDGGPATPVERGEALVGRYNCLACHSTSGVGLAGPTFKGLAGSTVQLKSGGSVVADRAYLVRSIMDPDAQIVKGYQEGIMSAVIRPGSVNREEAEAMAAYIESLR
jgi:cytochrome c oxidase subunit 2